ncbi:BTB/POZ domain-containing protein KCTD11 isoform X2 [Tachyglossus aculeatus]|uniref:BTB/POZ domain-containing protein KCTD11 isoform X2 n=1 Tax=Tachyglossus aculeatus TaxID=9261 RepID=UPI0018F78488|nr:BTB/POZ domain-containing protein KCTD11 isoform X2 [Tachyglossus aculeatus]
MLGLMFRGRGGGPAPPAPRGGFFIDRDGQAFRYVLNFLRLGRLALPRGYGETALLRAEADFYRIGPLLDALAELDGPGAREGAAALCLFDLQAAPRLVHFSARRGPHHYDLGAELLHVYTANLFCTDPLCLAELRARFGGGGGDQAAAPGAPHLRLEWAPRPEALPAAEYRRLGLGPLRTQPDGREVTGRAAFLEEVLQVALGHGFRLDSVFPDPEDLLNSRSVRLVRQ